MKVTQILPNGNLLYTADLLMAKLFDHNKADITFSLLRKNNKNSDLCHYHTLPMEHDTDPAGIITLHDKIADAEGQIKDRETLMKFSRIFCGSNSRKKILEQNGLFNIDVMRYAVDKKRFSEKKSASEKIRIGIFNRSNKPGSLKGQLNYIISLFKMLDAQSFSFILAGHDIEGIYSELSFLGYECHAHNYLPVNLMPAFFASADVIINLSGYAESMTLAEAVWTGTPFISNPDDMIGEYFNEAQGVMISGDQEKDIHGLNQLLVPGKLKAMQESIIAGRDKIPSWEDFAAQLYRAYEPEVIYAAA